MNKVLLAALAALSIAASPAFAGQWWGIMKTPRHCAVMPFSPAQAAHQYDGDIREISNDVVSVEGMTLSNGVKKDIAFFRTKAACEQELAETTKDDEKYN
jgi:hypothetical protein